jgi:hypothetical protein
VIHSPIHLAALAALPLLGACAIPPPVVYGTSVIVAPPDATARPESDLVVPTPLPGAAPARPAPSVVARPVYVPVPVLLPAPVYVPVPTPIPAPARPPVIVSPVIVQPGGSRPWVPVVQ